MAHHHQILEQERRDVLADAMALVGRPSILVVDDEPSIGELLGEILEDNGYRALLAHNGRTALAIARRERPALVLTDRNMPEMDGVELVRRLRSSPTTSGIPVILMSSVRPVVEGETIPFLEKPFDLDDMLATVASYARPTTLRPRTAGRG